MIFFCLLFVVILFMMLVFVFVVCVEIKGEVICIGVLIDMNGVFVMVMGFGLVEVVWMVVEEFGGRINGRLIEILQVDYQNKLDLVVLLVCKWFSEGVQVIVDGGSFGVVFVVQELVCGNGRIFFVFGVGVNQFIDEVCVLISVQWMQDVYFIVIVVVFGIMQISRELWFFIIGDYVFGYLIEVMVWVCIVEFGGKVVGSVKVQFGMFDYLLFLLQVQFFGVKIFVINVVGDNVIVIKQVEEFGFVV